MRKKKKEEKSLKKKRKRVHDMPIQDFPTVSPLFLPLTFRLIAANNFPPSSSLLKMVSQVCTKRGAAYHPSSAAV